MQEFTITTVSETPYLYVDRAAAMAEVATAMQAGLGEVWRFMEHHGVPAAGGALSVYNEMPGDRVSFRTGFLIRPEDTGVAQGDVKVGVTPAGRAMHCTHRGPYSGLGAAYQAMWAHLRSEALQPAMPTWEVYLNAPSEVHEEQLLTEVYQALAD